MSVDLASPQSLSCPKSDSRESSPMPEIYKAEENYASLQISSAEVPQSETAVSPLPSPMDLLIQDSPDSSTSPKMKLPAAGENSTAEKEDEVPVKKQKSRTVFSQAQLCILNDRFQRQKYLSLQQMQELSHVLNLSYKQVKTWFQNQRMKCKRWQKNVSWSKSSNSMTQKGLAPTEYLGLYSPYPQGCLVNASANLPMWSNQAWNNQAWNNQAWNNPTWSSHSWNTQTWSTQAWNNQFQNSGEESLQSQIQFQQNYASDLEAILGSIGESHNVIQQAVKYYSTTQTMDLFPSYYCMNGQPEDM
ncbi:homeobox protein NANOGP8-like [Dasypus novemcinctus]|uniref:homeobox protein NANOGP8-like n=1 Tax=Dasypus novemcinctus TaxID=9361 RepID=UPI0026600D04|nr:homeobox protein NANOGP8-like [Dasypus novemcinctus]